ncbi:MAG: hypothetical protein HY782_06840 [Chloroflexi bacterium]|nr:hypothetical protein [Chloroflexota bacterium]
MRSATIARAILMLAFVFALFVWTFVPSPVSAIECPPGQVVEYRYNPQTRQEQTVCVPQQQVAVVNAPSNPLLPTEPSKWDQAPRTIWDVGPSGGIFYGPGGDTFVTLPAGALLEDTILTLRRPPVSSLRKGDVVLRGDGDRIIHLEVGLADPNQGSITYDEFGAWLCFKLSEWDVINAGGPGNLYAEQWDGNDWQRVPQERTSVQSPEPPDMTWNFCVRIWEPSWTTKP